jgi:hypothetical protein
VGNKDDPRFVKFVEALNDLRAERPDDAEPSELPSFEEEVKEAEERFWATRGDPATEAARLLKQARRRRTTRQGKTDDRDA